MDRPTPHRRGRARLHEPAQRYLTAWTISGWRTVDLHQLDNREVDQAVRRALSDHPNDAIRISRSAQHRLDMVNPPLRVHLWWIVRTFVGIFVLLPACFVPPWLVCGVASAVFRT